jgi:hypothetical protein
MQNKRVLFITYDLSGYYDSMYAALKERYTHVDYYNTATFSFKYKNAAQHIKAFFYKIFTGQKLKNFYKYKGLIDNLSTQQYDVTLVIRPDVFFDSQLEILKKISGKFIAYYHDSINNIKRKKHVIHFFDEVYSYEPADVIKYDLKFIPNFIYFKPYDRVDTIKCDAFSVMSDDYRVPVLRRVAEFLSSNGYSFNFFVTKNCDPSSCRLISYIKKRIDNEGVTRNIKEASIIVDIHKFGIQDGLTFRVFEAMGYHKKLITTNTDVVNYDFYNPDNIFVVTNVEEINIPHAFFTTPFEPVPAEIYNRYTVNAWLDTVVGGKTGNGPVYHACLKSKNAAAA